MEIFSERLIHLRHNHNLTQKEVSDALSEGDTVKVKIISIEPDSGKISLSIKDANPKPVADKEPKFSRDNREKSDRFERNDKASFKKEPEKSLNLEDMLKEWTKQSNDRQTDINRRLKR